MSMFSRWFSLWQTSECYYSIGRARTVVNMLIKACLYTYWYPALHRAKQTHLIDQTPAQIWYIYIPGTYYIVLLGGSEGAKELCAMGTVSILFRISIRSKERFKTFPWNPRYPGKKHGTVPATNPLKPSCFPWKSMISLSARWQFLTQRHDALRLPWPREDSRRPRDPAAAWWTKLGSCGTSPRGYQWSYSNPKIARTIQSYEAIDKINK